LREIPRGQKAVRSSKWLDCRVEDFADL
jgi:hypothetical protein